MMHRIMLFVVLASAGCLGPTKTRGRAIGAITASIGTAFLISGLTSNCEDHIEGLNDAIACGLHKDVDPIGGGVLLVIGAMILAANELHTVDPKPEGRPSAPAAAPVPAPEPLPHPETADPMLRQLTLQASVAARTGACSAVAAIASRVARLDPGYRRDAFERDAKIAACLRD